MSLTNIPIAAPTYVDVNTLFEVNALPELLYDIDAINNSLYNLFYTTIGTRPFLREYGSYLPFYLQQPQTEDTADSIYSSLAQSIRRWEPRITLNQQASSVTLINNSLGITTGYFLDFYYTLNNVNIAGQFSYVGINHDSN